MPFGLAFELQRCSFSKLRGFVELADRLFNIFPVFSRGLQIGGDAFERSIGILAGAAANRQLCRAPGSLLALEELARAVLPLRPLLP